MIIYILRNHDYLELDMPFSDIVDRFNSLDDLLEGFLSDSLEYV